MDSAEIDHDGSILERFRREYPEITVTVKLDGDSVLPVLSGACPLGRDGKCHSCISFRGVRISGGGAEEGVGYTGFCEYDVPRLARKDIQGKKKFIGITLTKLAIRDGLDQGARARLDQLLKRFYALDVDNETVENMAGYAMERIVRGDEQNVTWGLVFDLYDVLDGKAASKTAGGRTFLGL